MTLITFFWIYNTKKVFKESRLENQDQKLIKTDWNTLVDELGDKMVEMKSNLEAIKKFESGTSSSAEGNSENFNFGSSTLPAIINDKEAVPALDQAEIDLIKEKLEEKTSDKIKFIY